MYISVAQAKEPCNESARLLSSPSHWTVINRGVHSYSLHPFAQNWAIVVVMTTWHHETTASGTAGVPTSCDQFALTLRVAQPCGTSGTSRLQLYPYWAEATPFLNEWQAACPTSSESFLLDVTEHGDKRVASTIQLIVRQVQWPVARIGATSCFWQTAHLYLLWDWPLQCCWCCAWRCFLSGTEHSDIRGTRVACKVHLVSCCCHCWWRCRCVVRLWHMPVTPEDAAPCDAAVTSQVAHQRR